MSEATPLTPSQIQEFTSSMRLFYETGDEAPLLALFTLFDRNGDHRISRNELKIVMDAVDSSSNNEEAIDRMVNEADLNKDGYIDLQEFIIVMKKHL